MRVTAHLDVDLVAHESDDSVTCLLQLQAPLLTTTQARAGQTLVVVLDRSGSMSGAPLEAARSALRVLVRRLAPQDRFGLVVFDHEAELVVPVRPMADHDVATVDDLIDRVQAGGMTDLAAGYVLGMREIRRSLTASAGDAGVADAGTVLLISDGHANSGDTDPASLRRQALAHFQGQGVTTATIGLGLGYDEVILVAMAEGGSGSHAFAEGVDDLPATIAEEVDGLLDKSVLAATLRITGRDGHLTGIGVLQGLPSWREGETTVVALGDLYAGEQRNTLVRLDVASIPALGLATIADIALEYTALPDNAEHVVTLPITVNVVPGDEAATRVPLPEVVVQKALLEANQAKAEAARRLREGDEDGARQALSGMGSMLDAFSASIHELRDTGALPPPAAAAFLAALDEESAELGKLARQAAAPAAAPPAQTAKDAMYSSATLSRGRAQKAHLRRRRSDPGPDGAPQR